MYTLHKIMDHNERKTPVHVFYINAKHQKKKEEIQFIYAFPQIIYKKFIFSLLYILHKINLSSAAFQPASET